MDWSVSSGIASIKPVNIFNAEDTFIRGTKKKRFLKNL